MNALQTNSVISLNYSVVDFQFLCRVCGNPSNNLNSIFDDHGCAYDFSTKINVYLPIRVQKSDCLPSKICSPCANTLLTFHQLYLVCQTTSSRFVEMLEAEGFDQQLTKQNEASDLIELQSSISREIENEILHMNDSKDMINEIESEIAANAAVKELERIGSTENISLVGEVIDQLENEANELIEKSNSPPEPKSNSDVEAHRKKRANGKAEHIRNGSKKCTSAKENEQRTTVKKEKTSPKKNKTSNENSKPIVSYSTSDRKTCDFCSEHFDAKELLVGHIKNEHTDLIFHCEMCDDYFAREQLISHMVNHAIKANTEKSNETSESNGKPEKSSESLKIDNGNNNSTKENQPTKVKRTAHCEECDKSFADAGGLRYHVDHFHKKIKNYECDICGNFFSCKRIITNHIRGVHMKERRFECNLCKKKFSTDSALYIHKKSHENVLNFKCEICDRRFRSQCKLKIHMTMHTKEKNYFCQICNRGFAVRNNLTKHLYTHSKSYDFKCDKCSYRANQKRYLFEHIKRTHKN